MPGPCPAGQSTTAVHNAARCADKDRCTGAGCRVRRPKYVHRLPDLEADARPYHESN